MKSFLEGRQVISREGLPADRAASQLPNFDQSSGAAAIVQQRPAGLPATPAPLHGEKKLETVEVDGVVQKIIVTCKCGEIIEIHCGY